MCARRRCCYSRCFTFVDVQAQDTLRRSLEYALYEHERTAAIAKLESIDKKRGATGLRPLLCAHTRARIRMHANHSPPPHVSWYAACVCDVCECALFVLIVLFSDQQRQG